MISLFSHQPEHEVALTITARTFFKVLSLILVTVLLLAVVGRATYAIALISIALLLALALNTPVNWVANRLPGPLRGNRSLATALAFLLVVVIIAGFLMAIMPPLIRQTTQLIDSAPSLVQNVRDHNGQINHFVTKYHLQAQVNDLVNELATNVRQGAGSAVVALTGLLSSIVSVLVVLVLTFMMVIEGPRWLEFFRKLVPSEHRDHVEKLRREMYRAVRGFVNGQVLLAVIAALLLVPGMIIFAVPYPAALAAVVFVCCLVPMVGNIVAAFFVAAVALFHSPLAALGILIYYIVYQQVENFIIQPRIQASATNLSPLLVLISLTVGLSVGGLLGGLVAIPVVACLRVWLLDYLETRRMLKVGPATTVEPAKD
jgi:predicted PurR-regulated permease PerM